jgi:hypothetical protein
MPRITVRRIFALLLVMTGLALPASAQISPQFNISVSPSIVTVNEGGMTSFTVNVVVNDKLLFDLSLSGLPAGVIAQIPVGRPGANTIVLSALPSATTGTFNVDATVFAGNNSQSQTFILNVKPLPVTQWEYRVEVARTERDLESTAAGLGAQSWELVSVLLHERNGAEEWVGFFKRRKHGQGD